MRRESLLKWIRFLLPAVAVTDTLIYYHVSILFSAIWGEDRRR